MKNKVITWCIFIIIFMNINACTKYIDEIRNWNSIPTESLFENVDYVERFVNKFYSVLPNDQRTPQYTEETGGSGGVVMNVLYGNVDGGAFTANDANLYDWVEDRRRAGDWTMIRQINDFFANIDKSTTVVDATKKKWFKGQAFFFRAYIYYNLVEIFGGVPIITDIQNPLAPASELNVARKSSLECFEYIKNQLDSAVLYLPARGTTGFDANRVDKVTAMALRSKTLVLKASPRFCNTKVAQYWQEAYDAVIAAKTEATAEGFGLYDDGTSNSYRNIWFDKTVARKKEFLFYVAFQYPERTGAYGSNWRPMWEHVKAYPMANGKEIDAVGSGYVPETFWANRDPRFYANIGCNGGSSPRPDDPVFRYWTFTGAPLGGGAASGFRNNKFVNPNLLSTQANQLAMDLSLIRYAELLLWHAECANEIGKPLEALDQLKLIRKRARIDIGADGRYGLVAGVGVDYQITLNAIMKERQIELYLEGQRFWDYARRRAFQELRNVKMFKANIPALNKVAFNALKLKKRGTATVLTLGTTVNWTDATNALNDYLVTITPAAGDLVIRDLSVYALGDWDKDILHQIKIPDEYYFAPVYQGDINKSPAMLQNIGWPGGTFDPRITK